ncbi:transposase [Zunongwangia sp. SCSIO 43204]|uniref:transposase n=1 Tax=Zunongwangia sp. SCSIO 43204 TaxID=2779359 RepID=UPI00351D3600
MKTVPGIHDVTAWIIAVKTEAFQRLTDPRKLACFAGLVPFEQQSGTSLRTKPRVSKMADMATIKNQTNYKNRLELS